MRWKTITIRFAAILAVALAGSVVFAQTGTGVSWKGSELGARAWAEAPSTLTKQAGDPVYDPSARTTEGLFPDKKIEPVPAAPGDILKSWAPAGLALAWGVGFDGDVWLSDVPTNDDNTEFTVDGVPTGPSWPAPWAGDWPADMAFDPVRGWMCQVNVGGDNGIYCWDPGTGNVMASISGAFPWTSTSQRGLAYRPDDDTFYIGGWNQGILYHVKGFSWAAPGEVLGQCNPPDYAISGLAWNPTAGSVWEATNSTTDTLYRLNPSTCAVLGTLAHPNPGYDGAGLEMDPFGNLWMIDQDPNTVYLIDSGVPNIAFDLSWNVMGGGGAGGPLTGSGFSMRSTLGQTAIDFFVGSSYEFRNGYWPGVINTTPTLAGLPDVIVDHTTTLPVMIDLWLYATDAESSDGYLTYTIEGSPPAGAGVSILLNRWLVLNPSYDWCPWTDVTIRVTDPGGLWDNDTFRLSVTWSCRG